jgi:hypothetical protein
LTGEEINETEGEGERDRVNIYNITTDLFKEYLRSLKKRRKVMGMRRGGRFCLHFFARGICPGTEALPSARGQVRTAAHCTEHTPAMFFLSSLIARCLETTAACGYFNNSYAAHSPGRGLLAPQANLSWRTTSCRLSASTHSVHSQLLSTA